MPNPGVYVELKDVRAYLRRVEPSLLPVLRKELKAVVDRTVVPTARSSMPTGPPVKGHAKNSVRATAAGNRIDVRAGGARAPHFGWLEFGGTLRPSGKRRNTQTRPVVRRGRYLYPALDRNIDRLAQEAGRGISTVLKQQGR